MCTQSRNGSFEGELLVKTSDISIEIIENQFENIFGVAYNSEYCGYSIVNLDTIYPEMLIGMDPDGTWFYNVQVEFYLGEDLQHSIVHHENKIETSDEAYRLCKERLNNLMPLFIEHDNCCNSVELTSDNGVLKTDEPVKFDMPEIIDGTTEIAESDYKFVRQEFGK